MNGRVLGVHCPIRISINLITPHISLNHVPQSLQTSIDIEVARALRKRIEVMRVLIPFIISLFQNTLHIHSLGLQLQPSAFHFHLIQVQLVLVAWRVVWY